MQNLTRPAKEIAYSAGRDLFRLGFWTSIIIAVVSAAALGVGITTPARSGPNYISGPYINYPYTDVAQFVPRDYLWMYPTLLMVLVYIVLMNCLHQLAVKHVLVKIALPLAIIATAALTFDYFIQLMVLQPSLIKGELEGLTLFSQYNPQGVFIALENVGYLFMGLSFLFVAAVFAGREKLDRAIRYIFVISGALSIASLIAFALIYRSDLGYRYEVAAIAINWLTLIAAGILLSIWFRRLERKAA